MRRGEGTPPYGYAVHLVAMRRGEDTSPYGCKERIQPTFSKNQTQEIHPIAAGVDFGFTEYDV